VQQVKQGPIAAGAGKLSLGNSLIAGQSTGGYLAELRAYAQGLGLGRALPQPLPLPVLLASAETGVGASPAATGLGLFARGRMRPKGRPCAGKKGRRTPPWRATIPGALAADRCQGIVYTS
jgi:hypothetical protein